MGLLDTLNSLRESYSKHQSKKREEAGIPQLRYKEGKEPVWVKERRLLEDLPVFVSPKTEVRIFNLSTENQKKVERYREVFKNSPKLIEMYVDKLSTASTQEDLIEALPSATLKLPAVKASPASPPKRSLLTPVVIKLPATYPTAVFKAFVAVVKF